MTDLNPPGTYTTQWKPVGNWALKCFKCGKTGQLEFRKWESLCGGYEDYHYRCACGHSWWVESADA